MKTSFPMNNFSSGQIDRELKGRYDLPLYQRGMEISKNFCQTIKGTTFFRTGTEFINEIGYASLHEFKFNQEQSYLLIFRIEYIEFFSYTKDGEFVQVLDDEGNALTLIHPWGTEIFNLCVSQNCDVMYIQHLNGEYPEYQLKRTAANKFELVKTTFTNSGNEKSLSSTSATENHGYPCTGVFYENRYQRCSSSKYYTYLYGSKGGKYDDITTGTNKNDGYQFDLAEAQSKALWLMSGANSLLIGTAEGVLTVNGGDTTKAITPTDITAKLSCRDGCARVLPIRKDNSVFFVSSNGRKLFVFNYDVLLEQFKADDLSKANYEITKGGITKLAYKDDRFGFMYAICGGDLLCICFSQDESVNAWSKIETKGKVVDICTVTKPDGDKDLFLNVKRVVNDIDRYYLERLSDWVEFPRREDFVSEYDENEKDLEQIKQEDEYAFQRTITEIMRDCVYLDCSIKYSGLKKEKISINGNVITSENDVFSENDLNKRIWIKTVTGYEYGIFDIKEVVDSKTVKVEILQQTKDNLFDEWYLSATEFSGLEHLEGEVVSVVGNGGYVGDFLVENGKINISSANTNKLGSAVIGLKYKGILKSPNYGMQFQGGQTFTKPKNIVAVDILFAFSAGGKVGTSLYNLEEIQHFNSDGLYDCPALPMNSSEKIYLKDDYNKHKHYYIVQDKPLPMNIMMVTPEVKQVI